jgi:hypothetical protein
MRALQVVRARSGVRRVRVHALQLLHHLAHCTTAVNLVRVQLCLQRLHRLQHAPAALPVSPLRVRGGEAFAIQCMLRARSQQQLAVLATLVWRLAVELGWQSLLVSRR